MDGRQPFGGPGTKPLARVLVAHPGENAKSTPVEFQAARLADSGRVPVITTPGDCSAFGDIFSSSKFGLWGGYTLICVQSRSYDTTGNSEMTAHSGRGLRTA